MKYGKKDLEAKLYAAVYAHFVMNSTHSAKMENINKSTGLSSTVAHFFSCIAGFATKSFFPYLISYSRIFSQFHIKVIVSLLKTLGCFCLYYPSSNVFFSYASLMRFIKSQMPICSCMESFSFFLGKVMGFRLCKITPWLELNLSYRNGDVIASFLRDGWSTSGS